MARVKSKNTIPELLLRRQLWRLGLRYRLHYPVLGVTTDIAFVGRRLAIFVDGCFWHGCPDHYRRPPSNQEYWDRKIQQNIDRDARQNQLLRDAGWRVIRVWECEVKRDPLGVATRIAASLQTDVSSPAR